MRVVVATSTSTDYERKGGRSSIRSAPGRSSVAHRDEEPCIVVQLKSYVCLRNCTITHWWEDAHTQPDDVYLSEKGAAAGFMPVGQQALILTRNEINIVPNMDDLFDDRASH